MPFDQLVRIEREAGLVPANDNVLLDSLVDDDTYDAPTNIGRLNTPQSRDEAAMRREAEKAAMQLARAGIARRTAHCVSSDDIDNDNEDFPLVAALRREGDNDSIELVLTYRRLVALCMCEPLQGLRVCGELSVVRRINNLAKESEDAIVKAAEGGWKSVALSGSEIRYKEVKKRKGGTFHLPPAHAVAANEETWIRTAPLSMPFNCDLLIRHIDAKPVLAEVRSKLGPLLDPFEDAVLGGRTYTEIGRQEGFPVKPDVAGKALVKRAIVAAEGSLFEIERRIRQAEREADRLASTRRLQIAVEKARYLGKAA
jgi:hypothetical protein